MTLKELARETAAACDDWIERPSQTACPRCILDALQRAVAEAREDWLSKACEVLERWSPWDGDAAAEAIRRAFSKEPL